MGQFHALAQIVGAMVLERDALLIEPTSLKLWPTYSRITVVIHHPWRATGPSTGMGRDRFSHEHWGAKIAPTSLAGKMANIGVSGV